MNYYLLGKELEAAKKAKTKFPLVVLACGLDDDLIDAFEEALLKGDTDKAANIIDQQAKRGIKPKKKRWRVKYAKVQK